MAEKSRFRSDGSFRSGGAPVLAALLLAASGCDRIPRLPWQGSAQQASPSLKAHAELLSEMYLVVLGEAPSKEEFAGLIDTLEQGASLEGVYNGLAHSARYRELEMANPGAPSATLDRFVTELRELESALRKPTRFTEAYAQPLARMELETDEAPGGPGARVQVFPGKRRAGAPQEGDAREIFKGASVYTLKRVLGDEALKIVSEKRGDPEARAAWYGKWAAGIAHRGGDFGLAQRNLADAAFHSQWARQASEDRLIWEVLNRVHRVLNPVPANRPDNRKDP